MKRLAKILAVIFTMGILFFFILPPIQEFFGLAEQTMLWVAAAIGVPLAWLALYGMPSFSWLSSVPTKLLLYRLLGVLISIGGSILFIGNRSGQLLTFPFAGTIVVLIGVFIFYFLGKVDSE